MFVPYLIIIVSWPLSAIGKRIHRAEYQLLKPADEHLSNTDLPTYSIDTTFRHDGICGNLHFDSKYPVILLSKIRGISAIECTYSTINITFDAPEAFDIYVSRWLDDPSLMLHGGIGNCNIASGHAEYQVASGMHWDGDTCTFSAELENKNIINIASSIQVEYHSRCLDEQFNTTASPQLWDSGFVSSAGQDVSDPPSVVGKSEEGYFKSNMSYSCYMDYDNANQVLRQLYVDVNITSADGVPLTLDITTPYNGTVAFSENALGGTMYSIPGVLDIAPSLQYTAGANIVAMSATVARTNLTNTLLDGHIHLDLVNPENTYYSGVWDGNYGSGVAIDPVASIRVAPQIALTGWVVVNVTGYYRELIQAFRGTVNSVYDFTSATGDVCTRTSYGYRIDAFNLDGWRKTLYNRQDPFTEGCR